MARHGTLFVVSAPSGAGKRTILKEVFRRDPSLAYSVSATTRPPRPGEIEGRDYHFLSEDEFRRRAAAGDFIEWAEVHGNMYGTPRQALENMLAAGKDVVLELDVQGMRRLKAVRDNVVTIFIAPPSLEELEARLDKRGANSPADKARRLKNARAEMQAQDEFDHVIVNDELEEAVAAFEAALEQHRNDADSRETGATA